MSKKMRTDSNKPNRDPMDLLDNIMDTMGKVPPSKKPKPEPKPKPGASGSGTSNRPPALTGGGLGSFRIPKTARPDPSQQSSSQPGHSQQRGGPMVKTEEQGGGWQQQRSHGHGANYQQQQGGQGRYGGPTNTFSGGNRAQGGVKREYTSNYSGNSNQNQATSSGNATDMGNGFVAPATLEVELNALSLKCVGEHETVDRYHIKIIYVKKRDQSEKDATTGQKNDLARQQRSAALFAVVGALYKKYPECFGQDKYRHVYDGGYTIYSIGCQLTPEQGEIGWEWSRDEMKTLFDKDTTHHFRMASSMKITLQHTGKLYIKGAQMSAQGEDMQREVIKFYEVLTSQLMHSGDHLNYLTKSFEKYSDKLNNQKDIGQGKCVKTGLDKNVRLLGKSCSEAELYLQGAAKASAFHAAQLVLTYVAKALNISNSHGPPDPRRDSKMAAHALERDVHKQKQAAKILKDVAVTTIHLEVPKTFFIKSLVQQTARTQKFEYNGSEISVYDYFREKYKMTLQFPDCPMVIEKRPGAVSFYPMEILTIEEGQRVSTAALQGQLTDAMMKEARMLPDESKKRMQKQLERAQLLNGRNKYMEAFGVKTGDVFLKSLATVLTDPTLTFKSNVTSMPASNGVLSTRRPSRYNFIIPGLCERATLVIFDQCMGEDLTRKFLRDLLKNAAHKGIKIEERNVTVRQMLSEDNEALEKFFDRCAAEKQAIVVFITAQKLDPVHRTVKLFEATKKAKTQHLWVETVKKFTAERGSAVTIENVLAKFNLKLGGLNHAVDAPIGAFNPKQSDPRKAATRCFENRMFVGLELSHAAAQCLYDRQMGVEVGEPTVVGMTYSLKYNTQLTGESWYQQPRLHNIKYLTSRFEKALRDYHSVVNKLPSEIVVYRAGASEGEFDEVRKEVDQIREACKACSSLGRSSSYNPKITMLVGMRNCNNILYRANMPRTDGRPRPSEVNVPSGTCVSSEMTNPMYEEFILTSQHANIGTSRPMRYTAVVNDGAMSKPEMEYITHWLCYGHQASTMPTHKPHVMYGAEELAKRGRDNWLEHINRNSEGTSSGSGRMDVREEEDADSFYIRMSNELNNKLAGTFWG